MYQARANGEDLARVRNTDVVSDESCGRTERLSQRRHKEPPLRQVGQRTDGTSRPGCRRCASSPPATDLSAPYLSFCYPCTGTSAAPPPADGFSISSSPS